MYPAPKKQRPPTIFSLSPTQPDEWEVNRSEITMKNKLGIIIFFFKFIIDKFFFRRWTIW